MEEGKWFSEYLVNLKEGKKNKEWLGTIKDGKFKHNTNQ